MKICTRENKERVCCCYCNYNEDCTVSCIVADHHNCDDCGDIDVAYNNFLVMMEKNNKKVK